MKEQGIPLPHISPLYWLVDIRRKHALNLLSANALTQQIIQCHEKLNITTGLMFQTKVSGVWKKSKYGALDLVPHLFSIPYGMEYGIWDFNRHFSNEKYDQIILRK